MICTLNELPEEKLTHLKAVVFCRSTDANVKLIAAELSERPKFASYHLFFSSKVES